MKLNTQLLSERLHKQAYPQPAAKDPPNWKSFVKQLRNEIVKEIILFYGSDWKCHLESRYAGLDYSYAPHRQRLRRWPYHARLLNAADQIGVTGGDLNNLCTWEGTWAERVAYEETHGFKIKDTTGDDVSKVWYENVKNALIYPTNDSLFVTDDDEPPPASTFDVTDTNMTDDYPANTADPGSEQRGITTSQPGGLQEIEILRRMWQHYQHETPTSPTPDDCFGNPLEPAWLEFLTQQGLYSTDDSLDNPVYGIPPSVIRNVAGAYNESRDHPVYDTEPSIVRNAAATANNATPIAAQAEYPMTVPAISDPFPLGLFR